MDHIYVKRTKLGEKYEKIISFDITCRNSVVDCFKNKCMEFYTKQLDVKSVQAYNTLNNTGKIVQKNYINDLFSFILVSLMFKVAQYSNAKTKFQVLLKIP